jgi:TPR repeat protein
MHVHIHGVNAASVWVYFSKWTITSFFLCLIACFLSAPVAAQRDISYDSLIQQGNSQLQTGDNEQALASATSAIKVNSSRWEAHAIAGGALLNLKRYEEAVDEFSLAIERAPEAKQEGLRALRKQCLSGESRISTTPNPTTSSGPTTQAEIVLWKTIERSTNTVDFQAYLQQYPNGAFVPLAKSRLSELIKTQSADLFIAGFRQLSNVGNHAAALPLFQNSCDDGYLPACSQLAFQYKIGDGATQDYAHAVSLYQKACDGGDGPGCGALGDLYANDQGVPQDLARAASLFQKACDEKVPDSCDRLASMYERGQGVAQDLTRSKQLYQQEAPLAQKYCDSGNRYSCYNLGDLYANGQGMPQDLARAKQFYQKACSLGMHDACGK